MNYKCQVFTPSSYVNILLDSVGYISQLKGKKILENSCGDGNVLSVVVTRYIKDCIKYNYSELQIKKGLEEDITGIEIDPKRSKECIENLDKIAKKFNIENVKWNVITGDYLSYNDYKMYDYVVGNPPYISYAELDKADQKYLKENFESCGKGKFDYCYAFIEKSINNLSSTGKMSYVVPSSIFKTVFGDSLRTIMLPYIEHIREYTQVRMFKGVLVKSAIVLLNKNTKKTHVRYVDDSLLIDQKISKKTLVNNKWLFKNRTKGLRRFGDFFKVSHAVATLRNNFFVLSNYIESDGYYICGDHCIESELVRDAATPKTIKNNILEKIIFPYCYDDNHHLVRYSEDELKTRYPKAYCYFLQNKIMLIQRKSDASALWFEYGRSQALANLDCTKYLMSTIVSSEIHVYKLEQQCIPYGGMYIVPRNDEISLDEGIQILKSSRFYEYAFNIGIPLNGKSVRITSRDIENYSF